MSVSVLVPSYNHALFVERTLRSIFAQTLPPSKLLVIDDGSQDESVSIIEKVLADCPFDAELIARENRGLCATLNEGLSKTGGEFFAYLGSDDIWYPDFLAARVKLLDEHPKAVLAFGHAHLIDENDQVIDSTVDWGTYRRGNQQQMLLRGYAPVSSTLVYRRSALAKVGWNERAKLEDYELYLQLSAHGEFVFDDSVLAAWRKHGKNTSRDTQFMLDEILSAQKRLAPKIGLSRTDLEQARIATKLAYLETFAREGDKKTAWRLLHENIHQMPSLKYLGKNLLRLCVPNLLFRKRRKAQVAKLVSGN